MHGLNRCLLRTPCSLNSLIDSYINNNNITQARKLFDENPSSLNVISWNKMMTAYIQHHQIQHAHDLFDKMPHRDTVSWNIMLSGFHRTNNTNGLVQCFLQMGRAGFAPDDYTLSTLLREVIGTVLDILVQQVHAQALHLGLNLNVFVGCSLIRGYTSLRDKGGLCQVFDDILFKEVTSFNALIAGYMELGSVDDGQRMFNLMPERNIISWTILVAGYIRNKRINEARSVFNKMGEKNVVSWTAMISGYVQNMRFIDALKLFLLMFKSGTRPNHFTLLSVLDACAGCSSLPMGLQVHLCFIKYGIQGDVTHLNSLVDMYAKCGDMDAAFHVFESILNKDLVSWNSIIGGYARHGLAAQALEEFDRMEKAGITPDEVTFTNVLSACVHGGLVEEGEKHFDAMLTKYGIQAEMAHYICLVDLYGRAGKFDEAEKLIKNIPFEKKTKKEMHGLNRWLLRTPCSLNSLIDSYINNNNITQARKLFDKNPSSRNVISWNKMMTAYIRHHQIQHAQDLFDKMPNRDIFSWSILVTGYIRNKRIDVARSVFNKMGERDVVSWTAMISGYVQNMRFIDALKLFLLMFKSGTRPNHFTLSSVLDACAGCSSLPMGLQVHLCSIKYGIPGEVTHLTSLVDMYAKCGDMDAAFHVFESILNKDLVSWSSIIGGYARHGLATRALEEFDRMEKAGITPDEVTFTNVLSACVHGGLVEEGEKHFVAMLTKYGIQAKRAHYSCLVDLYGKAGKFDEAEKLIKNMPFEPDVVLWGALLAGCGMHSNLELGEYAAERIRKLERNNQISYSMLSKIQGEKGVWSSVNELNDLMNERRVRKQKAFSWVG